MKVLDHVSQPYLLFTYTISSLIMDNYITKFRKIRMFVCVSEGHKINYAVQRPQDGQCTYSLTLRRVRVNLVAVEKQ
jgi:hypothetical protein